MSVLQGCSAGLCCSQTIYMLDLSDLLCGLQVQSLPACSNEHALVCRQALTDITARVLERKK